MNEQKAREAIDKEERLNGHFSLSFVSFALANLILFTLVWPTPI